VIAVSFQLWLEELSLDADRTGDCQNLAHIPLADLRRLYAERCAPTAAAIVKHRFLAPVRKSLSEHLRPKDPRPKKEKEAIYITP